MAYEQRPNTGSLFKNDKKEADSHPDYKGSALIDGLGECWLDAWINTSTNGTKYMSVKIKPKEARNSYAPARSRDDEMTRAYSQEELRRAANGDYDDEVPF